ncbi:flavin-containing monooxygenase [Mycobacterium shigaense]|uniref:Baeyer-Villiger monooxygenase n=1 Tax=Mycobacterium shigaense TaxID=722731 RepID=A0A1Z4EFA3_9MYCO|nr:NAD(P)/FAD-dependent oxidoreductase [Mycobacterium shigaense]MEA1122207.1 NAD(P)/FAD-dependent oxidoreductase [Mycobacterium shigaense]PRI16389.1 4-hydroxyacetophenone monooxygenase [Mycobacterium shigaense]BAX91651.1 monooxygenase [Mycobacterium shigaense]
MTDALTQAESTSAAHQPVHTRAIIIGTGFSGLGMAIKLQQQGVDFVILEKAADVGGTWRDNSYPGCACDIPSHLYSFSFEPKPDWKNPFSYQPEIWDYLKGVTEKYGLRRYIEFNSLVDRGHWDDDEHRWHVFTADGREFVGQFLISGAGALHIPSIPNIEGRDEFQGAAFHSAQWDHSVDLTGKRVAMIGTGASAIQIVPEIVKDVAELQLYQRTPPWVVPRSNPELPVAVRSAMQNVPGLRALVRAAIYWGQEALAVGMTKRPNLLKFIEAYCKYNIRRSVKDRELRRKLIPNYRIGCKRILNSSTYYGAVADPKTDLITDGITRITRDGIVTTDGTGRETLREADVIVYGTGFHVTDSYTYVQIKGRDGEDLVDRWNREGIGAHRGITVAGMPNLFFLLGPNTGLGHNSVVFMIESQIRYVADAIKTCDKLGAQALAPTRAAQDRFNDELQERLGPSVWNSGGCSSWYLDEHGKNTVLWGGYTWEYWRDTRAIRRAEYEFFGVGSAARANGRAVAATI